MSGDERWSVAGASSVELRDWCGDCVVYHGHNASTHLLSAAAGLVLQALLPLLDPVTTDRLCDCVFGAPDVGSAGSPVVDADRSALRALLAELERIGLVRRIDT